MREVASLNTRDETLDSLDWVASAKLWCMFVEGVKLTCTHDLRGNLLF